MVVVFGGSGGYCGVGSICCGGVSVGGVFGGGNGNRVSGNL